MIADTINSMKQHIDDAYGIVEEKGGTIPQNKNLENLSDSIGSISGEGENDYNAKYELIGTGAIKNMKPTSVTKIHLKKSDFPENQFYYFDFSSCTDLKEINVKDLDFYNANTLSFSGCKSIEELDFSNQNFNNLTTLSSAFYNTTNLKILNFTGCYSRLISSVSSAFMNSGVEELDLSTLFGDSQPTSWTDAFNGCKNLKFINFGEKKFSSISLTSFNTVFKGCLSLEEVDVSCFTTKKITSMTGTFAGLNSSERTKMRVNFGNFYTDLIKSMTSIFEYYNGDIIDMRAFTGAAVTNINYAFRYCNCKEIWLDNFDFSKVTSRTGVFQNASSSCKVYVKDETAQSWILALPVASVRPSSWSTANVIIAGSAQDTRNL